MKPRQRTAFALLALFASCTTVGDSPQKPLDAGEWRTAKSQLYHRLALQYLRAGDHPRARRLLEQAVQFEAQDARSLELLARLAYGDGDLAAAGNAARMLLQLEPESVAAHCTLGAIAEAEGDPHEAEQRYRRALHSDQDDPRPWNDLHRFLLNEARSEEASAVREDLVVRFPKQVEAFLDQGAHLAAAGRWPDAFGAYGRAIEIQPQSADAAARYAFAALACDRSDSVLELGRRIAPRVRLGSASLTIALAIAHIKTGDFEAALQELELLDAAVSQHPHVCVLRAELLVRIGQIERGRTQFEAAIAVDPTIARAHAGLARIHLREGRRHAGARALEKALQFDPGNGVHRVMLAASLAPDDPERARQQLERARGELGNHRVIAEVERLFPGLVKATPAAVGR